MADKQAVSVKYDDIEIRYDENDNVWRFTLRGRERSTESLAKAKVAIDKLVPIEKMKGFTPVQAWFKESYEGNWGEVTVTSIVDIGCGRQELWIKKSDGGIAALESFSLAHPETHEQRIERGNQELGEFV
jgi:hypothetical protein